MHTLFFSLQWLAYAPKNISVFNLPSYSQINRSPPKWNSPLDSHWCFFLLALNSSTLPVSIGAVKEVNWGLLLCGRNNVLLSYLYPICKQLMAVVSNLVHMVQGNLSFLTINLSASVYIEVTILTSLNPSKTWVEAPHFLLKASVSSCIRERVPYAYFPA